MNIKKAIIINAVLYVATLGLAMVINTLKGTPLRWNVAPVDFSTSQE